ncbi:MAG: type I glyceraldehyde-3-phosphate dehydrogenase [Myxococcales bacterium]|nr:type I glyceraldehyde-3-phosphate dehydrogenase [Myxococcales bacterium]
MVKLAINGFGRIGRRALVAALNNPDVDFVGINDLTDPHTLAHLLRYDSVHGRFDGTVVVEDDALVINGDRIRITAERDPAKLPWGELEADIVLECTGYFRSMEGASKHLEAGAKKVIISAPGKGVPLTVVMGVNHDSYDPAQHDIVSNASCTTNCLAPVAKVLNDSFGIEQGLMTPIHSYTTSQSILDAPQKDLRRARAAAMSIIPTTTGAAKAVSLVLPELNGRLDGMAVRVPTPNVSLVDLTVTVGKEVTVEEVNAAMKAAADGPMKGVLAYMDEPLVSVDFVGRPESSLFDSEQTRVQGDRLVKVLSWYDNEFGYASRLVDLAGYMASKM